MKLIIRNYNDDNNANDINNNNINDINDDITLTFFNLNVRL